MPRCGVAVLLAVAALIGAPAAAAYPWPIMPFDKVHPVRGNFGDPRTVYFNQQPDSLVGPGVFSFHNGVDISAPGGTRVYPIVSGTAHYIGSSAVVVRSPGRHFQYFHIQPFVTEGQFVYAFRTVLGTVLPSAEHVHLTEIDGGHAVNPLVRGHLTPYFDHTKPSVTGLVIRGPRGLQFPSPFRVCGSVSIAAAAQDVPALVVPEPWTGLPVAPALLTWTLEAVAGPVIVPQRIAVNFFDSLPQAKDFWRVYARGTFQNSPRFGLHQAKGLEGRFLFFLSHGLDTRTLPDGDYLLTVTAEDTRGNDGQLSTSITVDNASGLCGATG